MAQPPFTDAQKTHRWFGVELNNLAWDLVEQATRTNEETERMLHAAHASVYHWLQAGTAIHHLRGLNLLATVYAAAGDAGAALHYARRCVGLLEQTAAEQHAFDRAAAYGCLALAARDAGDAAEAEGAAEQCLQAAEGLDDMERQMIDTLYAAAIGGGR